MTITESTASGPDAVVNRRPNKEEMEKRVDRAKALFEADPTLRFDEEALGKALDLTGTQPGTIINKMLATGDIAVVDRIGKKRIFGKGDGTPAPVSVAAAAGPRRVASVPFTKILAQLPIGGTVRIVGTRLNDDESVSIEVRTENGRVVALTAA